MAVHWWSDDDKVKATIDDARLALSDLKIRRAFSCLNCVVIIRKGTLVHSRVYSPATPLDRPVRVNSVTKSIVSTLVGIAIDKGYIDSVHQTVAELLPTSANAHDVKSDVGNMTLHQLLSMSPGFTWRDSRLGIEPLLNRMMMHKDWVQFVLKLPVDKSRVNHFQYNSAVSHLLSAIISASTGQRVSEFANTQLFEPLDIKHYHWSEDPQGIAIGGWGLELAPIDMAKIGQLFLNRGSWQGQRILPEHWVDASSQPQTTISQATFKRNVVPANAWGYGYQWWLFRLADYEAYCAVGLGGQCICCVPALDAVIVTTSTMAGRHKSLWSLYLDYFIPALATDSA